MINSKMKSTTCLISLSYEGINKIANVDLFIEEGRPVAALVFEWNDDGSPKKLIEVPLSQLQESSDQTTSGIEQYRLSIDIGTDPIPSHIRAYLMQKYFSRP